MRATVDRVDVVGKRIDRVREAVGVLDGNFNHRTVDLLLDVKWVVQHFAVLVQEAHERSDPAFEVKSHHPAIAFIDEADGQSFGQKGHLAKALDQRVEFEIDFLEDRRIGEEGRFRARVRGLSNDLHFGRRHTALIPLPVNLAVPLDFDRQPLGQRIHGGNTDPVQSGSDFVALTAEFAAGVEDRHDHLQCGESRTGMNIYRDASPVVFHSHAVVLVNDNADTRTGTSQCFVDAVIYNLVYQVMKSADVSAADVHSGTPPDRFQPFQDLDVRRIVVARVLQYFLYQLCPPLSTMGVCSSECDVGKFRNVPIMPGGPCPIPPAIFRSGLCRRS